MARAYTGQTCSARGEFSPQSICLAVMLTHTPTLQVLEHQSEMRSYSDIEKFLLVYEFPGKTLFTTPTKSPNHRRYVSLHWAKTRTRRNKNKPEWALVSHEEKMATQSSSDGWLTYNTKRSNVIRPAGAILCGMWMVEWIVPGSFSLPYSLP